jgi:signal transduction histidine kinase
LFITFIFACGTTHAISILTVWQPAYRFEGLVKLATALISVVTAVLLWPLLPRVLALPGLPALEQANSRLAEEIAEHHRVSAQLRELNDTLEQRVSERTQALQESRASLEHKHHEMEQFLYTVSHDLKAPIVTCDGFLNFAREHLAAGEIAQANASLDRVAGAVQRMGRMLDDLLQLARAGHQLRPEPIDLRELLALLQRDLEPRLREAGAELLVADTLPSVVADREAVIQVLENLIGNALKYGAGEGRIRIEIAAEAADGKVQIAVRDHGPGIEPQFQKRIFALFQRGSRTDAQGTGLGLAIVSKLVRIHGGRVWLQSEPGHGATFFFELPASS